MVTHFTAYSVLGRLDIYGSHLKRYIAIVYRTHFRRDIIMRRKQNKKNPVTFNY